MRRTVLWLAAAGCAEPLAASVPPQDLSPENPASMSLRAELFVDDVAASVDFYTGVLGFTLDAGDDTYAGVRAGAVVFGLTATSVLSSDHYFRPEIADSRRGLGTEIVLEVDDVENFYGAVVQAGWPRVSELEARPWGATDFRLADPDGYYLRITSR